MSGGQVTQQDVLQALDTAMMAVHQARRMVELFQATPTAEDGTCKHQRQQQTFRGSVCMDCGADLVPPAPQEAPVVHGVPTDPTPDATP